MKLTFFVVGVAALIVTAPGAYTATTSSTPAMTTPPVLGRPPGYDRCDALFCNPAYRANGYYNVSPCSRNYCRCANGVPRWYGCPTGRFFDKSINACNAPNATFCPTPIVTSSPTPIAWSAPPSSISSYCNRANCDGRGVSATWYTLDLCTPYWCYCWQLTTPRTQAVQTCGAGLYFDFRSEVAACVNKDTLPWCVATLTTTSAPATTTSRVTNTTTGSSTSNSVVPTTTRSSVTSSTVSNTPTQSASTLAVATTSQPATFCDKISPYNVNIPATFPVTNSSFTDSYDSTALQLNCSLTEISDYITKKHNCLRSMVSPPASNMLKMQWNSEAAMQAQAWADNCVYKHNPQADRVTSQFGCGQNIAMNTPATSPMSWNNVINMWYNEVNSYVYGGANNGGAVTGHFTQIVWAKTWQIGCGWKRCGTFNFYVCNYCPGGNMQTNGVTDIPYQSGTSCASCSSACELGKLCTNSCAYVNQYSNCDALNTSYQICTPGTSNYNMRTNCPATCQCQGKIY